MKNDNENLNKAISSVKTTLFDDIDSTHFERIITIDDLDEIEILILNEEQKKDLIGLVEQIILKIRVLSRKPYKVTNMLEINELSDAIHNLPSSLVTNEPVDIGRVLNEFGIAGQDFYKRAKQILMKKNN